MFSILQILTVVFVAVAMALALAHALELPGKMRLSKETYYAMQPIYYPGFTIGGISEPVGIILTIILLFLMPLGSVDFWLTLIALIGLFGMQAVYWPAILILAKSCASLGNTGIVMTSEKPKRARTVERTGVV